MLFEIVALAALGPHRAPARGRPRVADAPHGRRSRSQILAATLNHSVFNVANAPGARLGGLGVAGGRGWPSRGPIGAALEAAGLLVYLVARAVDPPLAETSRAGAGVKTS